MKPEVTLKYLFYIHKRKDKRKDSGQKGFTLIELLVVLIIVGILAAVALPNLFAQVGKARETEAKNAVGTTNRGQRAYHYLNGEFSRDYSNTELQAQNALNVIIPSSKYYSFSVSSGGSNILATVTAEGIDDSGSVDNGDNYGTRDYTGGTAFDGSGGYGQIICQADVAGNPNATTVTTAIVASGTCAVGDSVIK